MKKRIFALTITCLSFGSLACVAVGEAGQTDTSASMSSTSTSTSDPARICNACLSTECSDVLNGCAGSPGCEAVRSCVLTTAADMVKVGICSESLLPSVSVYPETIKSCALARCDDECPTTAGEQYDGYCGTKWLYVPSPEDGAEKSAACDACLSENCCEEGLACGMSVDCWDAWGACNFNGESCAGLPGYEAYASFRGCKNEHCAGKCL